MSVMHDDLRPGFRSATWSRVASLRRWLGVGTLVLMAATWRLWTPQDVFPSVPLFALDLPAAVDWLALAGTIVGFSALIVRPTGAAGRSAAALGAVGLALSFLTNQHRLQPWAYQFFLLAIVAACGSPRTLLTGWRWLVIAIYAFSACSKIDAAFLSEAGRSFVDFVLPMSKWGPVGPSTWRELALRYELAFGAAVPGFELLAAILLAWPRSRAWGLWASWAMHLALILALGPWGLGHSWGVLLWNAFFLVQNALLFGPWLSDVEPATDEQGWFAWGDGVARTVLATAYLWPLAYPWGGCDAWIGWAVYAPPMEQVTIWIDPRVVEDLPEPLARCCRPRLFTDRTHWTWHTTQFDPNQWSLETLGVPCYPSSRFRTGVALGLLDQDLVPTADVVVFRRPDRWARELHATTPFRDRDAIRQLAATYRLNAFPRTSLGEGDARMP